MNSIYFAIGCIAIVLAVFWGSLEPEPKKLATYFGQRLQKPSDPDKTKPKKARW